MDVIKYIYSFTFYLFGLKFSTNDFSSSITQILSPDFILSDNFQLYKYVQAVIDGVTPIAIQIVTLFFMISMIKLLTQEGVERISWERIVLKACVFFILVYFINHSLDFFKVLGNIVQDVLDLVQSNITIDNGAKLNVADELINIAENAGKFEKYLYYCLYFILAIPYMGTLIMVLAQVMLRAIKILLYVMFAPIAIAFASEGDTYRGKALNYFLSFCGVCFEAIVIYVGTYIYTVGLNGMTQTSSGNGNGISVVIGILFLNGLLSALIGASSQISEKIFGRG